MERTNQILTHCVIDACLATYRRIHLGKQGGGYLNKVCTAQETGGSKTRHVADDSATERNKEALSFMSIVQCRIQDLLHRPHVFMLLSGWELHLGQTLGLPQCAFQHRGMMGPNLIIRDQYYAAPRCPRLPLGGITEQTAPYFNRITPLKRVRCQVDANIVEKL
jgi:hypothetical protein